MLSIKNVAKYILSSRNTGISTMKLHKICYFIQGWHLAICDKPMFTEGFEAWKYGPVSPDLEELFRGRSYILPDDENFSNIEDNLTDYQKGFVDTIVKIYDPYAALQLADMVRNHQAWITAYKEGYKTQISQDAIAREFHDMLLHIPS
jgi:phage-associated protein